MRPWWVVLIGVSACTRVNHSTLPPYVRDLRPAAGGIEMVQCEIVVTTKRESSFWTNNTKTTRDIATGACWNQVVSTEPPPEPPPTGGTP